MALSRRDLLVASTAAAAAALLDACGRPTPTATGAARTTPPAPTPSSRTSSPAATTPAAASAPASAVAPSSSSPPSSSPPSSASPPPLDGLPRPALASVMRRLGTPVLVWHQLRDASPGTDLTYNDQTYIVRPADFRAQLDEVARRGMTPVTLEQVYRHVTADEPLPPRPVALTFDDASAGQWPVAHAELSRRGWKATFFIMTVVLDKPDGWLTSDQVRTLAREGHQIAAHTWDHHPVTGYAATDWRTQLTKPQQTLARLTGSAPRFFAYPYGEWDRAAFSHLHDAGFLGAWQLSQSAVDSSEPLLTLRRRIVAGQWGLSQFRMLLDKPTT